MQAPTPSGEAVRVLALVVVEVLARLDLLPPGAVVAVPGDGLDERLRELAARLPAERPQARGVDRVAAVVTGPVLDVPDERRAHTGQLDDAPHDVEVLQLLAGDVVDAAGLALAQDELDPRAVILGVQPLAPLAAVPIDREREAVERVRDEERDQLLRILVRSVRVCAARDGGVHPVRAYVGEHLEVAAGLRGRVRARGTQRILLARRDAHGHVAVYLVRGDLEEARSGLASPLEEDVRPVHVRADEVARLEDGPVDVALRGEVDHGPAPAPGPRDRVRISDVSLDELAVDTFDVGRIARVGQLVEDDDLVAPGDEALDEVAAYEPATAGDEHAHGSDRRGSAPARKPGEAS